MPITIAIVGATGAVGRELISIIPKLGLSNVSIKLFASKRSAGTKIPTAFGPLPVQELTDSSFDGVHYALFSASSEVAKQFVPIAVSSGAIVIDNSSAYRMNPDVPLIIPEINPNSLRHHTGIIANPNCSTIIAITPLWPLHQVNPIQRLLVSTYQAASGAGAEGMNELISATTSYLENTDFTPKVFPVNYAFNLFSHNSPMDLETLYNEEETKISNETKKIFGTPNMGVSATCIRVPVLRAHGESITITCKQAIDINEARSIIGSAPGVELVDRPGRMEFPTPQMATGQQAIYVGRIRKDVSDATGRSLSLFVCGDQILKGAALNALQILQLLVKQ